MLKFIIGTLFLFYIRALFDPNVNTYLQFIMKQVLNCTGFAMLLFATSCKTAKSSYARVVYDSQVVSTDDPHGHAVLVNHYTQRKAKCYVIKKITTGDGTFIFVDLKSAEQLGIKYTNSAPVQVVSMNMQR